MVHRRNRCAFTLVELLVVIGIIGILVAVLLPAIQSARESARVVQCKTNLRQLGLAVQQYSNQHRVLPPGGVYSAPTGKAGQHTNWAIAVLPYLEAANLFEIYHADKYNTHPDNLPVLRTQLPVMICPTDPYGPRLLTPTQLPFAGNIATASYKGISGKRWGHDNGFFDYGPFYNNAKRTPNRRGPLHMVGIGQLDVVKPSDIRDGATNTFLFGEYHTVDSSFLNATSTAFWASTHSFHNLGCPQPEFLHRIPDYDRCMAITGNKHWRCDRNFASLHTGNIIQFAMCDASVVGVDPHIEGKLYEELATIDGGEIALRPE